MGLSLLIVDDELNARATLQRMLKEYCNITNVQTADSVQSAREFLKTEKFNAIFLDVAMRGENGFDLLKFTTSERVVLTTAYSAYAIQAIKLRVFDYLLKPIDIQELVSCIDNLTAEVNTDLVYPEIKTDITDWGRIKIPHHNGYRYLEVRDIKYLSASGSYTVIFTKDGKSITTSRLLKEYEQLLERSGFVRIHKSTIVNIDCVEAFENDKGLKLHIGMGSSLTVSRRKSLYVQNVVERAFGIKR